MGSGAVIWQAEMVSRDREKQREALLQREMTRQAGANQRSNMAAQLQNEFKFFDSMTQAMEGASPLEKEMLRKRSEKHFDALSRANPILGSALKLRYPKQMLKMKSDAWVMANPPPRAPNVERVSDDYPAAAQHLMATKRYSARYKKEILDQEESIVGYTELDEKMGVVITDEKGSFQVVNRESMNRDPKWKEIAEGYNTTVEQLFFDGGNTPVQSDHVKVGDDYVRIDSRYNVFTGAHNSETTVVDNFPGSSGNENKESLKVPEKGVWEGLVAVQSGQAPDKDKRPEAHAVYSYLSESLKRAKGAHKDPSTFQNLATDIDRKLSALDPRYTYVLTGPKEGSDYARGGGMFSGDLRLAEDLNVRFIPGRPETVLTSDGVPVKVIHDQATEKVRDFNGELYTDRIDGVRSQIESSTSDELMKLNQREAVQSATPKDEDLLPISTPSGPPGSEPLLPKPSVNYLEENEIALKELRAGIEEYKERFGKDTKWKENIHKALEAEPKGKGKVPQSVRDQLTKTMPPADPNSDAFKELKKGIAEYQRRFGTGKKVSKNLMVRIGAAEELEKVEKFMAQLSLNEERYALDKYGFEDIEDYLKLDGEQMELFLADMGYFGRV